ncbi:MAG TPA: hypothetical protein VK796_10630, partial [Cytophaga sp.]|nr:hypothetical protein [Cytophaga sp.]
NFCQAQINNSKNKDSHKKEKKSIREDTTQQKIIVYISYEIGEDSLAHNIKYIPMANQPAPTDEMIAEAIRIISEMKVPPLKDVSGQNRTLVSRIAFTPKKEN